MDAEVNQDTGGTEDLVPLREDKHPLWEDPRPVYAGDWAQATGEQRQVHMELVKAWKARHQEVSVSRGKRMSAGSGGTLLPESLGERELRRILNSSKALDSVKVQAAKELRAIELAAQGTAAQGQGELHTLLSTLRLLPPDERVDVWLAGVAGKEGTL